MLKADVNESINSVEFHGNLIDAVNDIANIVRNMYEVYLEDDPVTAEIFKICVAHLLGSTTSSVWKSEKERDGIKSVEIKLPDGFQMPGDE